MATTIVGPFLKTLLPRSAAAQLIDAGLLIPMGRAASITLPRNGVGFPEPSFVLEGDPIKVSQGTFTSATLGPPKKLAYIVGLTSELAVQSAEAAEAILRNELIQATAEALDAAIFSNVAASTSRPAGIMNGATAIVGTAGGGEAAFTTDLKNLIGALVDGGGGRNILVFTAPEQFISSYWDRVNLTVIMAPTLAAASVVVVEAGAFASGFTDVPTIETSTETLLHFEDTTPLQIASGTQGSGVLATPTKSLWQQDLIAIRSILRCAWVMRSGGMVQWINGTATW